MIGYAAIAAGLALVATSYAAPKLSKAITNAALICAVGALFYVLLMMGDY